jgi:membrane-bound lytic murein transglycosylase D
MGTWSLRKHAGLVGIALIATGGLAQEMTPEMLQAISGQIVQELSQSEFDPSVLALMGIDVNEVERVHAILVKTLASGSLEELAHLRSYAEQALSVAETVPQYQPYAAWLRQRLDYFQVADKVVRRRTQQTSPTPSRPKVVDTEADYHMWYDRIQKRNPPKRAASLVPKLKPVFQKEGVPEQMVWLAEVESSFNPNAESPVGACGLYQFMPPAAERFGLQLKPKDDRLDPRKSAGAAAKYLRILHKKFGCWQLALAAYNAGEGRVGRLLKKTGGSTFEDIAGQLPPETRMYVPKMRAVVQIREGVDLRTL